MKRKNSSKCILVPVVFTCLTLLCTFGLVIAQEITGSEGDFRSTIKKEFTVTPGGLLEMEKVTGGITVQSWGKNVVEITLELKMDVYTRKEAEEILKRAKSKFSQQGNSVTIEGQRSRRRINQHFTIFVPAEFDLSLDTRGGNISVETLTGELDLNTSGGNIELSEITGPVSVKTSGGNLKFDDIKGTISGRTSGGNIILKNVSGVANVRTSGGNILVTKATKDVTVSTSGGNLEIIEVSGNINGKTSGGNVTVSDVSGSVDVRTSGGTLKLSRVKGKLTGRTSGGDIIATDLEAAVEVRTSGGDVELDNVQAPIIASTSGGNMDVEVTLKDFSKPHGVELRTSGGDITLTLPAGIPVSIVAEIVLDKRRRSMKRYDIYSDFPLSKEQTEEEGKDVIRSTGDVNGGGDRVYLRTSAGNIYIKKR